MVGRVYDETYGNDNNQFIKNKDKREKNDIKIGM